MRKFLMLLSVISLVIAAITSGAQAATAKTFGIKWAKPAAAMQTELTQEQMRRAAETNKAALTTVTMAIAQQNGVCADDCVMRINITRNHDNNTWRMNWGEAAYFDAPGLATWALIKVNNGPPAYFYGQINSNNTNGGVKRTTSAWASQGVWYGGGVRVYQEFDHPEEGCKSRIWMGPMYAPDNQIDNDNYVC